MSGLHQSTRLGDLLVENDKISRQQLFEAIRIQQERRSAQDGTAAEKNELGEILIELGYISQDQLKSSLGWQKRLRKTTLVMTFVAPLLTAACGGGGAGGSTDSSAGVANTNTSTNTTISRSSSSVPSSLTLSSSSSSRASSSVAAAIDGPVLINWTPPTHRENGDYLDITEVGGYVLRYKLKSSTDFTNVTIDNGYTDSYYFNNLKGDYEFEIAAYDKSGLYSDFVKVNHH